MEVILLEKVANLGDLGDKVNVKSGYGRNFLLPQRKATAATAANVAAFEARRAELEKAAETLAHKAQAQNSYGRRTDGGTEDQRGDGKSPDGGHRRAELKKV